MKISIFRTRVPRLLSAMVNECMRGGSEVNVQR